MRSLFLSLLFVLSGLSVCGQELVLPEPERFHLFLLAGQSNMAGRGALDQESKEAPQRVLKWTQEGLWAPAVEPIHWDKTGAGAGLARSFATELTQSDPDIVVGLIPSACGGSSIRAWVPGGYHSQTKTHPYDDAIARARKAMEAGRLKAILWHQGESDALGPNAARYEEQLREVIARFRSDLGLPELPFLVGQLGQFPGKPWGDGHREVDAALRRVAESVPNVIFVSSEGLESKGDDLHFSTEALRELGRRYAKAYLAKP